jgi:signal transduction histidine kinase/ActR/RegA family two-component response regulator
MGLSFLQAKQFSEDERALMLVLANQGAQALERARAYAAERQARAEAEAANRIKDEFLATLSHELRTPLNAMLGWTQLLRSRKFDEAKMARALETIDRNTKSLAALIEDILDVSRIMTGKLHLSPRACQLVSVVEAAIEAVRPAAEAKTISIEFHCDRAIGTVWGDANRLQQVVWNLLSNAIKFTPKGGRVQVRLERITDESTGNPYAQIQAIDSGKGISPDFLPYVFERFRQENSSSTRSYGGLGLGLAIVRSLVELHGGTVQAFSEGEGLGATFTVQLPALQAKGKGQEARGNEEESYLSPDTSNIAPLSGLRILIVDDEADARDLLATILEQSGAQVTAVASADEAINCLLQMTADVLVSDIAMPNIDGYTLIRQVRALQAERGGYIPAVALTAYAMESDRNLALEAGFQVHLAKPFDPDELIGVIAKLAESTPQSLRL